MKYHSHLHADNKHQKAMFQMSCLTFGRLKVPSSCLHQLKSSHCSLLHFKSIINVILSEGMTPLGILAWLWIKGRQLNSTHELLCMTVVLWNNTQTDLWHPIGPQGQPSLEFWNSNEHHTLVSLVTWRKRPSLCVQHPCDWQGRQLMNKFSLSVKFLV